MKNKTLLKVIFLEIGGVLNSSEFFRHREKIGKIATREDFLIYNLDATLVGRLNNILKYSGAEIILSSSWRIYPLEILNNALKASGLNYEIKYTTERTSLANSDRGREILDAIGKYSVKDYIVLDAETADILGYIPEEHVVKTTWQEGLKEDHVQKIVDYFNEIGGKPMIYEEIDEKLIDGSTIAAKQVYSREDWGVMGKITADNKIVRISEMSDDHIYNSIRRLEATGNCDKPEYGRLKYEQIMRAAQELVGKLDITLA